MCPWVCPVTKQPHRTLDLRPLFSGLLPLFVLAHFAHHLLTALPVPLLPMIRSNFGLDYTQSGLLISAFSLSYGIGQLPAGWLADRIGARAIIVASFCGAGLAGFAIGFSQTYVLLIGGLILLGFLSGGYHPSAPPLISATVEPGRLGRALGLHVIGGSASYFLAPLIGVAIAAVWGWRGAFIGLAALTLALGLVFRAMLRARTAAPEKTRTAVDRDGPAPVPGRYRRLTVVIVLSTCVSAVIVSTIAFIPLFLVDHFGVGEKAAAAMLSIVYSAGLWAAPLGGNLSDRVGKIPVILAICFIAGPTIYLLNILPYGPAMLALFLLLGISLSVRMPVTEAYIVSHTSEANRSTVLGIYFFAAMESGGVLTPVMGRFIDSHGFQFSFTLAAAALASVTVLSSLALWGLREG